MKIRSFFDGSGIVGQTGFGLSITQPDLAYSLKELVEMYSVGQLPSLRELQTLFSDNDDVDDDSQDVRAADKADAYLIALENNRFRRSILERVKKLHDKRKEDFDKQFKSDTPPDLEK